MVKLYPTLIIPPIPSKQTIGDYAVKQAKAKEDAAMIARRKRMLQTFLNRIARHPILSNEHVFHRFLDGEVSWVSNSGPSIFFSCLWLSYIAGIDGSAELSTDIAVAQEYSQGTIPQPNGPECVTGVCCAAESFCLAPAEETGPAIFGFGSVHEQVCGTFECADGEGDEEDN